MAMARPHRRAIQQQAYGPPPGYPPPKKGMSTGMIVLIVSGCLFRRCVMCGAIDLEQTEERRYVGVGPRVRIRGG